MNRLTAYDAYGTPTVAPEYAGAAVRKLAAYEDMQEELERQLEAAESKLAQLQEAGKLKGATANQTLAQKIALKSMLGMYEVYGVD